MVHVGTGRVPQRRQGLSLRQCSVGPLLLPRADEANGELNNSSAWTQESEIKPLTEYLRQ